MPDPSSPVPLESPSSSTVSDAFATKDLLNFAPYAQTLADIIADSTTETPLVIGVFGDWGSGKTSLMRMVEQRIQDRPAAERAKFPVQPLWFNAWMYSRDEALWRALLLHVVNGIRPLLADNAAANHQLDRITTQLTMATELGGPALSLPGDALLPGRPGAQMTLPLLTGLKLLQAQPSAGDPEGLIKALENAQAQSQQTRITALDDFRRTFEEINKKHVEKKSRLVVFVDDLDRCLPERAVETLEAIKLFLDVPGCMFVLGIDRQVIERGIQVRYKDFGDGPVGPVLLDGARYLEKIIQIPFSLPPVKAEGMRNFVEKITEGRLSDPRCAEVFARGLEPNPRRIKRTLNIFLLLERLARNRAELADHITPVRLAKIVIIREYHPRLFALLTAGGHYLIDLEKQLRKQEQAVRERSHGAGPHASEPGQDTTGGALPGDDLYPATVTGPGDTSGLGYGTGTGIGAGPLQEFLYSSLLRGLLTWPPLGEPDANFAELTPEQVGEYIFLTRSTVEESQIKVLAKRLDIEPQMVTIPAGPFVMGTGAAERAALLTLMQGEAETFEETSPDNELDAHDVHVAAYAIGQYPVTNAEFEHFVEAGGYDNKAHWTEAGWKAKEKGKWTQPRFWDDTQRNGPNQPVVGVSWYEAVAYCNWLTAKVGDAEHPYRLPTEAEWEKAARGQDKRRYPWGNDWDPQKLNCQQDPRKQASPVGQYSQSGGDSPYGLADMAGNVWEWCSTRWGGEEAQPQFAYPYQPDDREHIEGVSTRILRGGSYASGAYHCRCSNRHRGNPLGRFVDEGFRCARTIHSLPPPA